MLHALFTRTFLGYASSILTAALPRALDFAGVAIDGMPTWRSEFRAVVAATDNGEFNESIVEGIAAGISFIKRFEAARSSKLGWGTYAATCRMAYVEGDPNPWAKCETEVRASAGRAFGISHLR